MHILTNYSYTVRLTLWVLYQSCCNVYVYIFIQWIVFKKFVIFSLERQIHSLIWTCAFIMRIKTLIGNKANISLKHHTSHTSLHCYSAQFWLFLHLHSSIHEVGPHGQQIHQWNPGFPFLGYIGQLWMGDSNLNSLTQGKVSFPSWSRQSTGFLLRGG